MISSYSTPSTNIYASRQATIPAEPIEPVAFDDLICFSHLRWNFVYQRPQHLMSRWASMSGSGRCRVWYIEEPEFSDTPGLTIRSVSSQLRVVVPQLPHHTTPDEAIKWQQALLDELLITQGIRNYALWYYTAMALPFSDHLHPRLTIFDCMDELSAFLGAPPALLDQERRLLRRANVVFTGGYSLYEAKKKLHAHVYAFPSCIDFEHFAKARPGVPPSELLPDPEDQRMIAGPRIGYSGVIDERMDLALVDQLAHERPDWHFIFLGPVVKINPASLPQRPNLHYLGMKTYDELPAYFSYWQAAFMPFALNEATRYISPTKTPEYLAAGLPVVSTPIRDVVRTYGGWEQVVIADSVSTFQKGLSLVLGKPIRTPQTYLDQFLREQSWDNTWEQMQRILQSHLWLLTNK